MAWLAPSAIPLPRQLWLTWQVLQWCGAGFTADGHGYGLPQRKMATEMFDVSWATALAAEVFQQDAVNTRQDEVT